MAVETEARSDGRDTRWAEHRLERRRELVEATLRAIRRHGAGVGMDDIAAEANTSKTVIYRHLGDRAGVYLAVVEAVDALILTDVGALIDDPDHDDQEATASDSHDIVALVGSTVDAYLRLVERDPEIYRFVVTRPLTGGIPAGDATDPVGGLTTRIGDQLGRVFARHLADQGLDTAPARVWGHGAVGFVRAAADHWLTDPDAPPREVVVAQMVAMLTPALATRTTAGRTRQQQRTTR